MMLIVDPQKTAAQSRRARRRSPSDIAVINDACNKRRVAGVHELCLRDQCMIL
ncbi:MAG: hypothetical protein H6816_08165 [Phycisphaerales bacterium]|nr:hypothetical protein [Phycisphaerales bacterium]